MDISTIKVEAENIRKQLLKDEKIENFVEKENGPKGTVPFGPIGLGIPGLTIQKRQVST